MTPPDHALERRITALLAALVLFDLTLSTWAFFFPQAWFDAFHGTAYVDPEALLPRMAANWAGFLLMQSIALLRWRRETWWLLIVAGVRFSDVFTDLVYFLMADHLTWFARATLPGMGPINALLGWWLIRAWKRLGQPRASASTS
ncbi:uncharacterized protein SOCE26_031220 [Sorangium cellulosum]|uniref:Uncharacterized protein n=1 Tax=Sorangium cellulosum TaxID=56 RepID=A0A2L0ER08_SORCE|nr:hypothetical protein [Sorangium cellulosum]AUX41700.1 uncharacterized protein SOCE26_031220 [Sorangium cellulosum]